MLGRIHMGLIICCIVGCIHDWTPFEEAVLEDMGVGQAPPAPSEPADEDDVDEDGEEALSFTARGTKVLTSSGPLVLSDVAVDGDPTEDGALNPGEQDIRLRLTMMNDGRQAIEASRGILVSRTDGVTIGTAAVQLYRLEPGETKTAFGGPSNIDIEPTTIPGTQALFELTLTDESGDEIGMIKFEIPITAHAGRLTLAQVTVQGDANEDGRLNPGESEVAVRPVLSHEGTGRITALRGRLESKSEHVSVDSAMVQFYAIDGGEQTAAFMTPRISVAADAPVGHIVELSLVLADAEQQPWTVPIELTIEASDAEPTVRKATVVGDSNDDGLLNPGERDLRLNIELTNQGTARLSAMRGTLSCTSDYVTIGKSQIRFYAIEAGETGRAYTDPSEIAVSPDTPPETMLAFELSLVDEEEQRRRLTFTKAVKKSGARPSFRSVDARLTVGTNQGILKVSLTNRGTTRLSATQGDLQTESADVTISTPAVRFYAIEPGETVTAHQYPRDVRVAADAQVGRKISFTLTLTDAESQPYIFEFEAPIDGMSP